MSWFRVDSDIGSHPKVGLVAERLDLTRHAAIGVLTLLWAWASVYARDGRVRADYLSTLVRALDLPDKDAAHILKVLVEARVLDRDDKKGVMVVHGFLERNGYQLKEVERKRKARELERKRARTGGGHGADTARTGRAQSAPNVTGRYGT